MEEVGRLRKELAEVEKSYQDLKAERKQLQQQREERENQGLQQQSEISQVRYTHNVHVLSPFWKENRVWTALYFGTQLHGKLLETERQLGEVQGRLKEQRQLAGEKLKDREQQVADLQLKLSRLEEQVK